MSRRLLWILKPKQLILVSMLCATAFFFLSKISRKACYVPGRKFLVPYYMTNNMTTTQGRPQKSTVAFEDRLKPLSVNYNGTPISEIYQSGFDVEPAVCPDNGSGIELVVVVHTTHENEEQRTSVRRTWGSLNLRKDAALVFLLGKSLIETLTQKTLNESHKYGDIIFSRNIDTYNNLTLKTIAMAEWVSRRCPAAKFFLKADDDIFLNVPRLLEFLKKPEVSTANRTVFGGITRGTHPVRSKGHCLYISMNEYPSDTYPDYMQGASYLITGDLSSDLYQASLLRKFFRMEDIFFTGLIMEWVGVSKVGVDNFYALHFMLKSLVDNVDQVDPCTVKSQISIHFTDYEQMFRMWYNVFDRTLKC